MNKSIKIIRAVAIILVLISIISIMNCVPSWLKRQRIYEGEYLELYSIAINTLLGARGYGYSEQPFQPRIEVIDEDKFGRKLFIYFENSSISTYSLIISQKNDDDYTYFYPDYNFISFTLELKVFDNISKFFDQFPVEKIEELKRKNDWDMEIDESKCLKEKIVRKKDNGPINERKVLNICINVLGNDAYPHLSSIEFFKTDDYNRAIYFGRGKISSNRHIIMLFNPDGSYNESTGIMELFDIMNYQDELKNFKELNNWNKPYN